MKKRSLVCVLLLMAHAFPHAQAQTDSERLGMALEYFQSQKYHESLLIFRDLEKKYRLNPRFQAYMGVCCYYEWDYMSACKYLDAVLPQMDAYSPQERSVYYFADAESHFQLQHYPQAIPLFDKMLLLCHDNEKPDAYYRLGFCYLFGNDWLNASKNFQSALELYKQYRSNEKARIAQLNNMINGLHQKLSVAVRDWRRVDKDWEELYGQQFSPGQLIAQPSIPSSPIRNQNDLLLSKTNTTVSPNQQDAVQLQSQDIRRDTISHQAEHDINLSDIYKRQTEINISE